LQPGTNPATLQSYKNRIKMLNVDFAIQAFQSLPIEEQQKFAQWLAKHQQSQPAKPKKNRKKRSTNVPSLEETRAMVYKAHGWT